MSGFTLHFIDCFKWKNTCWPLNLRRLSSRGLILVFNETSRGQNTSVVSGLTIFFVNSLYWVIKRICYLTRKLLLYLHVNTVFHI